MTNPQANRPADGERLLLTAGVLAVPAGTLLLATDYDTAPKALLLVAGLLGLAAIARGVAQAVREIREDS